MNRTSLLPGSAYLLLAMSFFPFSLSSQQTPTLHSLAFFTALTPSSSLIMSWCVTSVVENSELGKVHQQISALMTHLQSLSWARIFETPCLKQVARTHPKAFDSFKSRPLGPSGCGLMRLSAPFLCIPLSSLPFLNLSSTVREKQEERNNCSTSPSEQKQTAKKDRSENHQQYCAHSEHVHTHTFILVSN